MHFFVTLTDEIGQIRGMAICGKCKNSRLWLKFVNFANSAATTIKLQPYSY